MSVLVTADSTGVEAELPFPIRVSGRRSPRASTSTTDAQGTFKLNGPFSGAVTLQFTNAADGAPIGPLGLEIPAGSATLLENIEIRTDAAVPERIRPSAVRQLDVFGRLDLIDCADGEQRRVAGQRTTRARRARSWSRLTQDTLIAARDGSHPDLHRIWCAGRPRARRRAYCGWRIRPSSRCPSMVLGVSGPPRSGCPGRALNALRGVVSAVACARGLLEVAQPQDQTAGAPHRPPGRRHGTAYAPTVPCRCTDVAVGDDITVRSRITPAARASSRRPWLPSIPAGAI